MNVLIVARTKMSGTSRCIGGLTQQGEPLRLMTSNGENYDTSCPFQVGQVWEIDYVTRANAVPPHVEDVLVRSQLYVGVQPSLRDYIVSISTPVRGGINSVFEGLLDYTTNGNAYICAQRGVPTHSTGFWLPDRDLRLRSDGKHYDYQSGFPVRGLSYVGEAATIASIPAGTLVRVSLARWWKPPEADDDFEQRCYAQLSGWYN